MNIRWAWEVLRAKSFAVATDKGAYIHIPLHDPKKFTNIIMLSAQQSALVDFRDKLNEVIKEHEQVASEQFK